MKNITLVSATRGANLEDKALGKSLRRIPGISKTCIVYSNTDGLCTVYNRFLTEEYKDDILLFVHDDVFLEDYWLAQRLNEALNTFDVVGIAGQSDPPPSAIWDSGENPECVARWDAGTVAMGDTPLTSDCIAFHGSSPRSCYMIDGLFIAVNTQKLLEFDVRFDESFAFGLYDLDFSRTCLQKGLKIGVWPIVVTHQGFGRVVGSDLWFKERDIYKEKWGNG
jgi:hypothetical protein